MNFIFLTVPLLMITALCQAGCFESHITEAMAINHARAPLYSEMSQGASIPVSQHLIEMEQFFLSVNNHLTPFDRWSKIYEPFGIAITCEDLVPMSQVPPLDQKNLKKGFQLDQLQPVSSIGIRLRLWTAYSRQTWSEFAETCRKLIKELSSEPQTRCLTRHFIESMGRIAALAPSQIDRALKSGQKNPQWILRAFLVGHLTQLASAQKIDEEALPLNAHGLPILCQDVPSIDF